eukprot:CAMPEP_0119305010 /NCGR_PEP_ID=MMETSP1333-20130426/6098_1 /TAXON_ID=418940 /ORGANISM="Scyphosphaera apsteinii, Strain RCC1455" /LENGTH=591 /DNA_ID=CAMNT_0007308005 /DNA_START=282 /DNA_END=2057 /DNA_ORIENTATION=-
MAQQLQGKIMPHESCMATSLEVYGKYGEQYVLGHEVFMSSVLHHHPTFGLPLLVFSRPGLMADKLISRVLGAYNRTILVAPLAIPWRTQPLDGVIRFSKDAYTKWMMSFGREKSNSTVKFSRTAAPAEPWNRSELFYMRLQMFACTVCANIYAFDTGDMLVLRPFMHTLPMYLERGGLTPNASTRQAGGHLCRQLMGFVAPPICYRVLTKDKANYFNAGMYLVGGSCLGWQVLAQLMDISIMPPINSKYSPKRWVADQDTLNMYFWSRQYRAMPCSMNVNKHIVSEARVVYGIEESKRVLHSIHQLLQPGGMRAKQHEYDRQTSSEPCAHGNRLSSLSEPVIIHYLGPTKPWTPRSVRIPLAGMKRSRELYSFDNTDQLWWAEYLRDKTVVVGAGPSVKAPLGHYIDLCQDILRINDWTIQSTATTGLRTTHAFVHKATHGNKANTTQKLGRLGAQKILLAGFGEPVQIIDERMQKPNGLGLRLARKELTLLPDYYHTRLNKVIGLPKGKHALTGSIAVAWAIRNTAKRPVFVVGLDLMWANDSSYTHGDKTATVAASLRRYHSVPHDSRWLHALEQRGEIRRLDLAVMGN